MQGYTSLRDMFDGGGAGKSGDTFEGGPISGLLNEMGVRPMGYRDRQSAMASVRPQARPSGGLKALAAPKVAMGDFGRPVGFSGDMDPNLGHRAPVAMGDFGSPLGGGGHMDPFTAPPRPPAMGDFGRPVGFSGDMQAGNRPSMDDILLEQFGFSGPETLRYMSPIEKARLVAMLSR